MAKDESVPPMVPHVPTDQTGGAVLPVRGVSNPDSPTARLETTDTGRNEFSYEGFMVPLEIKQTTPAASLYEYIKAMTEGTLAIDIGGGVTLSTQMDSDDVTTINREVEEDVTAFRGFLLKSDFANTGKIFIGNKFTGAINKTGKTASAEIQPAGRITATDLAKTTRISLDFGATTPIGFPLDPGESLFIEINRASNIYLYASTDQKLYWMAV